MSNPGSGKSVYFLQEYIDYFFRENKLLHTALSHSSYQYEVNESANSNEVLEFVGDSVLELIVRLELVRLYPKKTEGELSRMKSQLVNKSNLARISRKINLGDYLKLGKGEESSGGRNKDSLLADAYEALVGGIFMDGGLSCASRVALKHLELCDDEIIPLEKKELKDFKTTLQEFVQKQYKCTPEYFLEAVYGPDHSSRFHVSLKVLDKIYGLGIGSSKKKAEQVAAKEAIKDFNILDV
ncbi:MAG: ribonuclease III [bacterium]